MPDDLSNATNFERIPSCKQLVGTIPVPFVTNKFLHTFVVLRVALHPRLRHMMCVRKVPGT